MPINPNISLAVKGLELQNPLDQYSKAMSIRNAQQQNQLAQMQMQQSERELASTNALNQAYKQAYNPQTGEVDLNALRGSLATGGFGSKLPGIEKSILDLQSARTSQKKLEGEVAAQPTALAAAQTKLLDDKLKQSRQFLETLNPNDPNAAEAYMQWHRANHADPVIGKALEDRGITVDQSMARIQQLMQTPGGLARLINESKVGTEKFMEMNKPNAAPPPMVAEYNFARSPEGGGFRGSYQDFVIAREAAKRSPPAPAQPVAPTITTVEDPNNPGKFLQVDARTYRGGGAGSPGVIGGARPSAAAEKTAAQKTQLGRDLGFAIKELGEITKDGGLIDQSTGSGAGRLVDIGAGFVGQAMPGAIAIGKIAPVADLALKMVPRFEGPQSDKDTASYKEAAGQLADPTLPTKIRKEAGRTVLRLMKSRKDQFVTNDMAAEGAGATPAAGAPDPLGIRGN